MGGSSILPTTIYKNKLYFLFGKERDMDDTPGWSDFGGGIDKNESALDTAIREGGEEMTGFLGDDKQIKQMLTKYGTYKIDYNPEDPLGYRVHIFPMKYDDLLPYYYNNNQRFLQKKLDPKIIRDTKIFEKAEIKWFCVDDLKKTRSTFRSFYQNIVDLIIRDKIPITQFIRKNMKKNSIKYITKTKGNKSNKSNKSKNNQSNKSKNNTKKIYFKF